MMLVGLFVLACSSEEPKIVKSDWLPNPQEHALLEKADAFDGKADQQVHHCLTCSLYMQGNPEFVSGIGGLQTYFCSSDCLDAWQADPSAVLVALRLPPQ